MLVAVPVVAHRCPVDRALQRREVERALVDTGRLERGQSAPGVSAGEGDQVVLSLRGELQPAAVAARVGEGAADHLADVVVGQRFQAQQQRPRQQRRDDREERVLGGRGDEREPAVLDRREQHVLLRLGEAVHLVEEEQGTLAACRQRAAGVLDDGPHVLHGGVHGRQLAIAPPGRQQVRDRRLPAAWWADEDQAGRGVAFGEAAQRSPGADQAAVTDHLIKGARAHASGQRCHRGRLGKRPAVVEQGHLNNDRTASCSPCGMDEDRPDGQPAPVRSGPQLQTPAQGLTEAQVLERVREGRTNAVQSKTSRTVSEILRTNIFTFFNGLLLTLFVVILATGRWQNGLFGLVIVANSAIGIIQEVRAKRTLDQLAVLNAPRARVVRAGTVSEIDIADVVADDLVELQHRRSGHRRRTGGGLRGPGDRRVAAHRRVRPRRQGPG